MRKFTTVTIIGITVFLCSTLFSSMKSTSTYVYPPFKHTWGIVRGTPTKLYMLLGNRVRFSNPLGLACVRLDSWENPKITADDDEVTVYGVNSGQNLIIYNKSMKELGVYGDREAFEARLNKPWGISANKKGDVYVSDEGNNRIVRLSNSGSELKYVKSIGSKGAQDGQFNSPRGIALDNSGNYYICDYVNNRIQVFDKNDEFQFSFFQLYGPVGIAVIDKEETWSYVHSHEREEFIIVLDSAESRISKFTLKGKLLKRVSIADFDFPKAQWEFVAIDYYSQIHIPDRINHMLWKFDRNLNLLSQFGNKGSQDGEFIEPRGISVYRRFGQIFIAEREGAQYYWVGTDLLQPEFRWNKQNRILSIKGYLTEPSNVDILLLDSKQKVISPIAFLRSNSGTFETEWDGNLKKSISSGVVDAQQSFVDKSELTTPVKTGNYTIKIEVRATYSSNRDFVRTIHHPITIN